MHKLIIAKKGKTLFWVTSVLMGQLSPPVMGGSTPGDGMKVEHWKSINGDGTS